MPVSHRVTGTWAELTADGAVTIPSTPQAGDRMYLFARWKDFSVTATVAGWTELEEFADGSVASGNGTGSVKVACWYRDWQAGDSNPTIDFSANPNNASAVIIVMQKGAGEVWQTPLARTAAMTNWTTTSQSVSASATVTVPSDGVVMGLIGIRDDTATMTRPASGIDDSGGLVTWNGNYVESPATHHSTTTGDDGAADLGYRLVTTGASGVTLRMTGTISAAETGAALWVVQGVSIQVTPSASTLSVSLFAPLLLLTLIPAAATVSTTGFAPSLRTQITPPAASQSLSTFAPAVRLGVTPTTASLTLSTSAPTITLRTLVTPPSASLVITTSKPHVRPYRIMWADPGGDAVQATGYFNTVVTGAVTFDTTQKVVGVGSWKCDSDDGSPGTAAAKVSGVLGESRRISFYWRYDSLPDAQSTVTQFVTNPGIAPAYSGGGFTDPVNLGSDNGVYATAAPARNAGQGSVLTFSLGGVMAPSAVIDSVKIIYERKYDVNTSIGISRVKYRIDGVEGANHDNTDMPLTDTVVTVDVTSERGWTPPDFADGTFAVIAEARRGDTDTSHTQSWDYVKVEVVYHLPAGILAATTGLEAIGFQVAVTPRGAGVVLKYVPGAGTGYGYDGITELLVNTWYRISLAYVHHDADDLDICVYVDGIQELIVEAASTDGKFPLPGLYYGWLVSPGANHLSWFDQISIDAGDDLLDPGDKRSTSKSGASVSDNEWDTTVGTGAVNERPPSVTNYKKHTGSALVRQSYTLQTAAVGDVDISGENVVGYMGWAWAALQGDDFEHCLLILNGTDGNEIVNISTTFDAPSLLTRTITSSSYPSDADGIGMAYQGLVDSFLYECGVVAVYEGPNINPNRLLGYQSVANETLDTIVDDLRSDPPDSYEVCARCDEFEGTVEIAISSLDQEGGSFQPQGSLYLSGGVARRRIASGIEVRLDVTVTGSTMLEIWRRINID